MLCLVMSIKLCSPLIMMTRGAKVMSVVWGKGNGLGIQFKVKSAKYHGAILNPSMLLSVFTFKDGKGVRRIQSCGDCYD
jgi:hypothetical protein